LKHLNLYLDLFFTFARIGACTFGGGYAMLPILQREVVEKKGWATDEDLTDYYAIGQCTPGIIAVNTATFIGYKYKGIPGGVVATLGLVAPSIVIISVIAAFLRNFADIPVVAHALTGVNACVVALIASSVWKLGKTTLKDPVCWINFLVVLILAFFFGISPAYLIVGAGLIFGYVARQVMGNKRGGEGK
jgi:chromate transporter